MTGAVHRKRLLMMTMAVALMGVAYGFGAPLLIPGQLAAYALLSLLPGMAIYILFDRRAGFVDLVFSSIITSPLLTGAVCTLLLLAGLSAGSAARIALVLWAIIAVGAVAFARSPAVADILHPRRAMLLGATIVLFCAVAGYLPMTEESWRQWADAWFHGAVVAQIDRYGIPPEDPYFAGMALQYMWFYHVVTITLAKAMHLDAFKVMPMLNMQALAGFALGAYFLGRRLRRGFSYGYFALLTVMLALNAGIWLFLPLKVLKSLVGEMRGWSEIVRNFSLIPFNKETAGEWVDVFFNQTFLLNKFIVSTAFSLGLCYMSALWYGVVRYLDQPERGGALFVFVAVAGMLLFHPLVAFVMLAAGGGAFALLWLFRRHLRDFSARRMLIVALTATTAVVVVSPYLYSVTYIKEGEQLFPLSLSVQKSAGILISCALALILACFQFKRMAGERSMRAYVLLLGTVSAFIVCNVIQLPGPNTYDKLPFFLFFPLAVIGSWTFADRFSRPQASGRFRRRVVTVAILLLAPVNVLLTAAYFNTSPNRAITPRETVVARWVAAETPRDALFLDSGDRVFLLVAGPRRYYWGRQSYAEQWGYPRAEMTLRRHVRDTLFSTGAIDGSTLQAMGNIANELYVIARDDEPETGGSARFLAHRDIFREVFREAGIAVFQVDRAACLDLAAAMLGKQDA